MEDQVLELPPHRDPQEILRELDTGWPWPLDTLQDWFEGLWNQVLAVASKVWAAIKEPLWGFITTLWSWVTGAFDWLWGLISASVGWLGDRIKEIYHWLHDRVGEAARHITEHVWGFLTTIWGWIQNSFSWLWGLISASVGWLGDRIKEIYHWLYDRVGEAIHQLSSVFTSLGGFISTAFSNLWTQVSGAFQTTGSWIVDSIVDPWTDFLVNSFKTLGSWLTTLWNTVWTTISGAWKTISTFITEDVVRPVAQGFQWVGRWMSDVISSFLDMVTGFMGSFSPITPEASFSAGPKLLAVAGVGIAGLAGMTIAGELMHPLKELGFGHISAMIGDLTNYRMISAVYLGVLLTGMIRTPMTYYVNKWLRPWFPDRRDIIELRSRRRIPEGTFVDLMGYSGYADNVIGWMKELANTPLRYFALAGIARTGFWDEEFYKEEDLRSGYSDKAIEQLQGMFKELAMASRMLPCLPQVRRLFKDGFLSEPGLRARLEEAALVPTLAEARILGAKWEKEYNRKHDRANALVASYRRELRTDDQLFYALLDLGMEPEDAFETMDTERIRKESAIFTSAPEVEVTPEPIIII